MTNTCTLNGVDVVNQNNSSQNHFSKDPNVNSLQYSCLENSMDKGVWWSTVQAVAKESDMTEWLTFIFLKKKIQLQEDRHKYYRLYTEKNELR